MAGVSGIGLAELPAHDGLLDPDLAPVRRDDENDGNQAAPLADRQRSPEEGEKIPV